jgi:hypothetical protein
LKNKHTFISSVNKTTKDKNNDIIDTSDMKFKDLHL